MSTSVHDININHHSFFYFQGERWNKLNVCELRMDPIENSRSKIKGSEKLKDHGGIQTKLT